MAGEPFASDENRLILIEGAHGSVRLVTYGVHVGCPLFSKSMAIVSIRSQEVSRVNWKALVRIDGNENRSREGVDHTVDVAELQIVQNTWLVL